MLASLTDTPFSFVALHTAQFVSHITGFEAFWEVSRMWWADQGVLQSEVEWEEFSSASL